MEFDLNSIFRKYPIKIFPNFNVLIVCKQTLDQNDIVMKISNLICFALCY